MVRTAACAGASVSRRRAGTRDATSNRTFMNGTPSPAPLSTPRGSDVILRTLEQQGVAICFGMPGGAVLPLYDAIARGTTIRHVLARHEQGAGHMAQGYARASGQLGVVLATSGPGATNLVTPIADARMDSTPLLCITGQVRQELIGTQAFQECDIASVVDPLVKRAWRVRNARELPTIIAQAARLAHEGRPGPVLVDVPRDVQEAELPPDDARLPGPPNGHRTDSMPIGQASDEELRAVLHELEGAARPVLYAGGGAQGASAELRTFAERAGLPVVLTLMGKGAFPETHELFVGCPGMHGTKAANWTLNHADLIIAAGARFDDRVTGRLDAFAPVARIVHIDIDPREHGKIRHADVPIAGELGTVLGQLLTAGGDFPTGHQRTARWREQIEEWRIRFPLRHAQAGRGAPLKPQDVVKRTAAAAAARATDTIWTTGVGQHQMWAMQYCHPDQPRSFITSGGHGTMGFGLPAAIGAKAARPDATVICIDGDGSFQMTCQELTTATMADLPVIVVVLNNGSLGMVSQWQTMFYAGRLSHVDLGMEMPDLKTIARGHHALAATVRTSEELDEALDAAMRSRQTMVLDVRVDPGEPCFPMIGPGSAAVDQLEWAGDSA